jgi:lipid II:glycine glycyltransferase (peptidoglycan interpeptide bridge formation enzyme)
MPLNELGLADFDREYFDIQGVYGYNGVASSSYEKAFAEKFYKAFEEYCNDSGIIVEFTRFHNLMENNIFSRDNMNISFNRRTVVADLTKGHETLWKEYESRNRNMIRKAVKNGLQTRFSTELEQYREFYNLYTATMEYLKADGFYFFDWQYFEKLFERFKNEQFLVDVLLDGKTIASANVFCFGDYAHYHLSARDDEHKSLGAGNLALDAAIKRLVDMGCKKLNLGGGYYPNDSLLKFKKSFSKNEVDFFIGNKIHNKDVYKKICSEWEKKNPDKAEIYSNIILKYRR